MIDNDGFVCFVAGSGEGKLHVEVKTQRWYTPTKPFDNEQ